MNPHDQKCTAPVDALHSTLKTDQCKSIYCFLGEGTLGAQKDKWADFCATKCHKPPEGEPQTTCIDCNNVDTGVNTYCEGA